MKVLKWIGEFFWTVAITVFFIVAVIVFCFVIALPMIFFALTRNPWWLLFYLVVVPLILFEKNA